MGDGATEEEGQNHVLKNARADSCPVSAISVEKPGPPGAS